MWKNGYIRGKRLLGLFLSIALVIQSHAVVYAAETDVNANTELIEFATEELNEEAETVSSETFEHENVESESSEEKKVLTETGDMQDLGSDDDSNPGIEAETTEDAQDLDDFQAEPKVNEVEVTEENDELNIQGAVSTEKDGLVNVSIKTAVVGANKVPEVNAERRYTVITDPEGYKEKAPIEFYADNEELIKLERIGTSGKNYYGTFLKAGIVNLTANVDGKTATETILIQHISDDFKYDISEDGMLQFFWNAGYGIDRYEFYYGGNLLGEVDSENNKECNIEIDPALIQNSSTNKTFAISYYYNDGTKKTLNKTAKMEKYTISYEVGAGTNNEANPACYYYGDVRTLYDAIAPKGYHFGGWYTTPESGKKVTSLKGYSENLTLYARYYLNSYSVKCDSMGGTKVGYLYYTYGGYLDAPAYPTKTDCVFDGWFTDKNFSEENRFDFSKTVYENIGDNTDFTLYAKWCAEPKAIRITSFKDQMLTGKKRTISVNIYPEEASQEFDFSYTVEPENCASVEREGNKIILRTYDEGSVILNFSTENGLSETRTVIIQHPETIIEPSDILFTNVVNGTLTIARATESHVNATVVPSGATNKKLIWTSADDTIVDVDEDGNIYGVSEGTTTVTATAELGGFSKSIEVTVEEKLLDLKITATGTGYAFKTGGECILELQPTPRDYKVKDPIFIAVDNKSIRLTPTDDSGLRYTTGKIKNAGVYNITASIDGVNVEKKIFIKHRTDDFSYSYDTTGEITFKWNAGSGIEEYAFYDDDYYNRNDLKSCIARVSPVEAGPCSVVTKPFPGNGTSEYFVIVDYYYTDGENTVHDQIYKMLDMSKQYKINYHVGKGTNSILNPSFYYKGYPEYEGNLDDAIPPVGYRFEGWYTDSDYKNRITTLCGRQGDIDLYAKYISVSYTVRFVSKGGSHIAPKSYKYGDKIGEPEMPVKAGCVFVGWYMDEARTVGNEYDFSKTVADNFGLNDNFTLYAKWKFEAKEINLDAIPSTMNVGDSITASVKIMPSGADSDFEVSYSESSSGCVKVNKTKTKITIKAKTRGTVTFTFTTPNGLSASKIIKIKK